MSSFKIYLKIGICTFCSEPAIIFRKSSQKKLCIDCFIKEIEAKISKTISKYHLFKKKDKIVVGLSGGKDSMTLLHYLNILYKDGELSKPITALIIDEGIKGYRNRSVALGKKFCKKNDINFKIISFKERIGKSIDEIFLLKNKLENSRYLCNYCAIFRRRLLNEGVKELGGTVLALGHNLTDISETFIMNILHNRLGLISGQNPEKISQTKFKSIFPKRIKPLMEIPEEDIFLYINIKQIPYYPSHCPYSVKEPILRRRVLNFIQDCKQDLPEIESNLYNDLVLLSKLHFTGDEKTLKDCVKCGYPSKQDICIFCKFKSIVLNIQK
ncbi:MAG: ATP-binding protein [Promethearchaeota archaeon]